MKITLYAIVPGDTREEAIEHAHGAFLQLCATDDDIPGGSNPLFDRYRLYTDNPQADHDGIYSLSESGTTEINNAWSGMKDKFQSFEDREDGYGSEPFSPTRNREITIYDEQARPVLSKIHLDKVIEKSDWVVAAVFTW